MALRAVNVPRTPPSSRPVPATVACEFGTRQRCVEAREVDVFDPELEVA